VAIDGGIEMTPENLRKSRRLARDFLADQRELYEASGAHFLHGQLLRYVNWVKMNLAEKGQRVRGIIICRTMTDDLRLACAGIPDVELYEYQMSVSVAGVAAMEL
jgi:endonuclease